MQNQDRFICDTPVCELLSRGLNQTDVLQALYELFLTTGSLFYPDIERDLNLLKTGTSGERRAFIEVQKQEWRLRRVGFETYTPGWDDAFNWTHLIAQARKSIEMAVESHGKETLRELFSQFPNFKIITVGLFYSFLENPPEWFQDLGEEPSPVGRHDEVLGRQIEAEITLLGQALAENKNVRPTHREVIKHILERLEEFCSVDNMLEQGITSDRVYITQAITYIRAAIKANHLRLKIDTQKVKTTVTSYKLFTIQQPR